jgi:hypothetical protein
VVGHAAAMLPDSDPPRAPGVTRSGASAHRRRPPARLAGRRPTGGRPPAGARPTPTRWWRAAWS